MVIWCRLTQFDGLLSLALSLVSPSIRCCYDFSSLALFWLLSWEQKPSRSSSYFNILLNFTPELFPDWFEDQRSKSLCFMTTCRRQKRSCRAADTLSGSASWVSIPWNILNRVTTPDQVMTPVPWWWRHQSVSTFCSLCSLNCATTWFLHVPSTWGPCDDDVICRTPALRLTSHSLEGYDLVYVLIIVVIFNVRFIYNLYWWALTWVFFNCGLERKAAVYLAVSHSFSRCWFLLNWNHLNQGCQTHFSAGAT